MTLSTLKARRMSFRCFRASSTSWSLVAAMLVALSGCGSSEESSQSDDTSTPVVDAGTPTVQPTSSAPNFGGGPDLGTKFSSDTSGQRAKFLADQLAKRNQPKNADQELEAFAAHLIKSAENYERRGYFKAARKNREQVLQISRNLHGDGSWQMASAQSELRYHEWFSSLQPEQRKKLEEATALERTAMQRHTRGEYIEAGKNTVEAINIWQSVGGDQQVHYAFLLSFLASQHQRQGDFPRAIKLHQQAVELFGKQLGQTHPDYAASLDNMAVMYQDQGDFANAERFYRSAVEIRRTSLGDDHTGYAMGLNNLAALFQDKGELQQAESLYHQSLAIFKKNGGERHPFYASGVKNLAVLHLEHGDINEAQKLAQEAAGIFKIVVGQRHPNYAICLRVIGRIQHKRGQNAEAERTLNHALALLRATTGFDHPSYAKTQLHLGEVYVSMKKFEAAEPLLKRSLESREKMLGASHPQLAANLVAYAQVLRNTGRGSEATKFETRARALQARTAARPGGRVQR